MTYDEGFAAGMRRAAEITLLHMKDFCDSEDIVTSETNRTLKDVSAAILAAIPASAPAHPGGEPMTPDKLAAAGLRVKPLEWEGDGHWFSGDNEGWLEEANTPFGWGYAVEFGNNAESPWIVSSTFGETIRDFDSPDSAKAAAQADYEARILAALDEVSDE